MIGCAEAQAAGFAGTAWLASAPGRLDVLGGIADYAGATVLELPLAERTWVLAQPRSDGWCSVASPADGRRSAAVAVPLAVAIDPERLRSELRGADGWARYALGAVAAVAARGAAIGGCRLLVRSQVPEGAGVSSSAALEVAALRAVSAACGVDWDGLDLAVAAQGIEHRCVGAACGLMDQATSALGERDRLLLLACRPRGGRPAAVEAQIALPPGVAVWGIDSGVRHAVAGDPYSDARIGCFMGWRIVAAQAGLPAAPAGPGRVRIADDRWDGQPACCPPSELSRFALPEAMSGRSFLAAHGGIADAVASVDPARIYRVAAALAHPVHEHQRVLLLARLLSGPIDDGALALAGELLLQSHAGYRSLGLTEDGTEDLVARVLAARRAGAPLFGARITGGGSGGAVAVLGRSEAAPAVTAIAEAYRRAHGRGGRLFAGSSPGAMATPVEIIDGI